MSRNFKDIIDEGFSQLALLADKRREILSRAEKITGDVCAAHNQAAGSKLQATESHILPEINACSEHLLQELQQTIAQVTGDNARFQSGLKDTLQTSVSLVLAQLARTRTYLLSSARERLDILLLELDTEFQADKLRLGAESTRRLSELDNWSLSSQSALRQAQSEMSLRVSLAEYKTTAQLGKTFGQIIQDAETKRQEITEYLNSLLDQQVEKLSADSTDLHSRLEPLIQEQCEKMKELCATRQQSLNHIAAQALSSAIAGFKTLSNEPLSEMEKQTADFRQEHRQKLDELRQYAGNLLQEEHQFLLQQNNNTASGAGRIFSSLAKQQMGATGGGKLDEAFSEISHELSQLAEDLNSKLSELLNTHLRGLSRLNEATSRTFGDLSDDFHLRLKELVRIQETLCEQKENEISLRLQKLESQVSETFSLLSNSGYSFQLDSAGGADQI